MVTFTDTLITQDIIDDAYNYEQFLMLVEKLFEADKTTNNDNTEAMLNYTKITLQRLNRITRNSKLSDEFTPVFESNDRPMIWLVLNEGWCGDSSQNLPFIHKIAEATGNVELKIILRDQNPELMDMYLTNGTRSIPKLIALDADTLEEIGTWGPRPAEAQELFLELKADETVSGSERTKALHTWYAKNKGYNIQMEFADLIANWQA